MKVLGETVAKSIENYNVQISKQLVRYLEFGPLDLLTAVNSVDSNCLEEIVEVDMGVLPRHCLNNSLTRYIGVLVDQPSVYNLSGYPDFVNQLSDKVRSNSLTLNLTPAMAVASLGIIFALVNSELSTIIFRLAVEQDESDRDEIYKTIFYLIAASYQILEELKVTNYDGFPLWREHA